MNPEAALSTFRLEPGLPIAQASPWPNTPVTLTTPALAVLTDLTQVKAATTRPTTTLADAEQQMIYQGVRMLFVVGEMPAIVGLVTAADLRGEAPMQAVHQRHSRYDELTVADVMTSLASLDAVDHAQLASASVGNVVATLKRHGRDHLLVIEAASQRTPRRIRGLFSRSQLERQLGSPIAMTPVASSFSEIERALAA